MLGSLCLETDLARTMHHHGVAYVRRSVGDIFEGAVLNGGDDAIVVCVSQASGMVRPVEIGSCSLLFGEYDLSAINIRGEVMP